MRFYNVTQDPDEHMAHYKKQMMATSMPYQIREACMFKSFGSSLVGPALQWFINLPGGKMYSFAQVHDTFSKQFSNSKKPLKVSDDLYEVVQAPKNPSKSTLQDLTMRWS